jgi:HEAT repeat protein
MTNKDYKTARLLLPVLALACVLAGAGWAADEEKPAVTVTRTGDLYTVASDGATLGEVLQELEKVSGVPVQMPQDLLNKPVTMKLEGASYEKVAQALAGSHALIYERGEDGTFRLVSAQLTSQQAPVDPKVRDLSREERRRAKEAQEAVQRAMDEIAGLYGYAGVLDYDAAKNLVKERQAKFDALVEQLAALGTEGAFAMRDLFGEADVTRQRLAMVKALQSIDSADASAILGSLYQAEATQSLQREIIAALGHRADALDVISSILAKADDRVLKAGATMALAGRPDAQPQLLAMIGNLNEDPDIRKEAIRSLGEVKNDASREALSGVALSPLEKSIRLSAIQELARTYGAAAMGTFETLLTDPDEAVRVNVVKAVARVRTPEAVALLTRVVQEDPSDAVRNHALARMPREEDGE